MPAVLPLHTNEATVQFVVPEIVAETRRSGSHRPTEAERKGMQRGFRRLYGTPTVCRLGPNRSWAGTYCDLKTGSHWRLTGSIRNGLTHWIGGRAGV
jgi:hypothetical protein